jgi:hypothetical protein
MSDPCLSVQLADLILDGTTPDANGTVWTVTKLDGWFDSTVLRVAQAEVQPLGEVITVARENGRPLTLEAWATTSTDLSPEPLGTAGIGLARATAKTAGRCVYVPALLIVGDDEFGAGTLSALVRRVGQVKQDVIGKQLALHVQWQLLAPDPRRYEGATGAGTGHD